MKVSVHSLTVLDGLSAEAIEKALNELQEKGKFIMPGWERKNFLGALTSHCLVMINNELGISPCDFVEMLGRISTNMQTAVKESGTEGLVDLDELVLNTNRETHD